MSTLEEARDTAAVEEFENYEFEGALKAQNGWEFSAGKDEWSRPVFLKDPENPEGDSLMGSFTVVFEAGTANATSAYASLGGEDIGYRPEDRARAYP